MFPKPSSLKHRSTFLPLQHAATLIFSVDWGLAMLIVDTHVHIGRNHYEPVEMLLAQMELNGVAKTVLVQSTATLDN